MAAARINKRNNVILISFFAVMYTIFGLLYTKTGNDLIGRNYGLDSMPNAGISPVHFEQADRNEVITSLKNVKIDGDGEFDFENKFINHNYFVDMSAYEDEEDDPADFIEAPLFVKKQTPPPGYTPPPPTTKAPKTTKAPRPTFDPLVFSADKNRKKQSFIKSKDYKNKKSEYDLIEKRFKSRSDTLKSFCKNFGELPEISLNGIYTDASIEMLHKSMLYKMGNSAAACVPYKSANVKFAELSCFLSKAKDCNCMKLRLEHRSNPRLWSNDAKQDTTAKQIVKEGKNNLILSVRHPLERAIATWYTVFKRNTLQSHVLKKRKDPKHRDWRPKIAPFMTMYNRTIRRTLGINRIMDLGDDSHWITWPQYVKWITSKNQGYHNMILPQYGFCDVCNRHYEYIIKTRTLGDDMDYLLHMNDGINEGYAQSDPRQRLDGYVPINEQVKGFLPSNKPQTLIKTAKKYLNMLSPEDLNLLIEKYTIDMQAFGYGINKKNLDLEGLEA